MEFFQSEKSSEIRKTRAINIDQLQFWTKKRPDPPNRLNNCKNRWIISIFRFFEDRRPSTLSKIGEKLGLAPNFVRFGPDLISHFERGSWLVTIRPLKKVILVL